MGVGAHLTVEPLVLLKIKPETDVGKRDTLKLFAGLRSRLEELTLPLRLLNSQVVPVPFLEQYMRKTQGRILGLWNYLCKELLCPYTLTLEPK